MFLTFMLVCHNLHIELQDWVMIINRDAERQRTMPPQRPYSDAYINGLPPKRRKVLTIHQVAFSSPHHVAFSFLHYAAFFSLS